MAPIERIDLRQENLEKIFTAFKKSIELYLELKNSPNYDQRIISACQDSVIKHFEMCYEMIWKHLKQVLLIEYGISVNSSKKVFLECRDQGIFSDEEINYITNVADSRNKTTHEYSELMAKNMCKYIVENYYPAMQKIIERLLAPQPVASHNKETVLNP